MRKIKFTVFVLAGLFILSTTSYSQSKIVPKDTTTSVLGGIWKKITGSSAFVQQDLVGKWNYKSTACTFETENLLKKAGGAIVATQVESKFNDYCQKLGIKEGNCSFTFNSDSTYSAKLGIAKLSGKYKLDEATKTVTMSYMLGVGKMRATAYKSGSNLKLLFDADGFLKMMKTLSIFTKNNSVEVLAAMADMYDGMLLGFDLNKEKETKK